MKKIVFRASGAGSLMTDKKGAVITDKQLQLISDLEDKLKEKGKITDKQNETLIELKAKRDAKPELSDTAKTFIQDTWLLNEKGFYKELDNKYVDKGNFNEDESITMITEIDGIFYKKNDKRITKGNLTGECDIISTINGKKVIQDVKSSWDARTFMSADMTKIYEWQLRIYMHLYDADEAWLRYCLTDCPEHIYELEKYKVRQKYNIIDDDSVEVKPLFDQLRRNLFFTNDMYTLEEKVKTYKIERDDNIFQKLLDRIPAALEYYNNLKLNIIE